MIRIDGFFLYTVGFHIHTLSAMQTGDSFADWFPRLHIARERLEGILALPIKTARGATTRLLERLVAMTSDPQRQEALGVLEVSQITSALTEFEYVLGNEMAIMDFYLVTKKGGYDTTSLIMEGVAFFPAELATKVPEAVPDVNEGTKCIAFELPTAAGFHLHRANESVLHRYYDAVTAGAPRPAGRNIGDYLRELEKRKAGDPVVRSALKDLKDLHRNPLIHPEHSLDSVVDAVALMGSIVAVIVPMLKAIT